MEGVRGDALAELRNRNIGFVFQSHHLLREFSALENAMIPCLIGGRSEEEAGSGPGRSWRRWGWGSGWTTVPDSSPAG